MNDQTYSCRNYSLKTQQRLQNILNALKETQEEERRTYGESDHYQHMAIQPIHVIESWLTLDQFKGFLLGNILKYIGRYNLQGVHKGGVRDLRKAMDYLGWLIDEEQAHGVQEEWQEE